MRRLIPVIYIVIGAVIANDHNYYAHLDNLSQIVSAVVGTLLWPLILANVNLHVKIS